MIKTTDMKMLLWYHTIRFHRRRRAYYRRKAFKRNSINLETNSEYSAYRRDGEIVKYHQDICLFFFLSSNGEAILNWTNVDRECTAPKRVYQY